MKRKTITLTDATARDAGRLLKKLKRYDERVNFSRYIEDLIRRDIEKTPQEETTPQPTV